MPKVPVNFNNSMIYKLCCRDTEITDIYVGSTTNFKTRKNMHKSSCCNENGKSYNLNVYQFIRENGGWDNWDMILIEKFKCSNKLELLKRERYYIETLNARLNSRIPSRSKKEQMKEYREKNKDKIKKQTKEYYEKNKEQIKEKRKKKIICKCGASVSKRNISTHKKSKMHNFYDNLYNFIHS